MEQALKDLLLSLIEDASYTEGYSVRIDYSGRSMYGKNCIGVVGDEPLSFIIECVEHLVGMSDDLDTALEYFALLKDFRQDNMGLQSIVYFPKWTLEGDAEFAAEIKGKMKENEEGEE